MTSQGDKPKVVLPAAVSTRYQLINRQKKRTAKTTIPYLFLILYQCLQYPYSFQLTQDHLQRKRESQNVAHNSLISSVHENCLQNLSGFFSKCLEAIINIPQTQIIQEFSHS